ncbi:hypothetical protein QC763_0091240 [Podospora pseudopauciseta]|uniref:Uncharacterized protein n=2 Tax=Podospora TaxID=5144 RepID=A0ABR0H4D7_9PEZI|nr:hypothetical protein QC763_0091240 [Podospora pseudopauciseta]KAK4671050.1 hypothetical protein QC764_0091260 [Podospora pseudoanserina]
MDLAASKCAICDIYCVSPHERSVPSLQVHGFKMGSNQSAAPITPLDAWAGVLESTFEPLPPQRTRYLATSRQTSAGIGGAIEACQA